MEIQIKLADTSYLTDYTNLFQRTFESTYTDDSLGLTKECFSKEVFNTERIQEYLKSKLVITDTQKTWLAFDGEKVVGCLTISKNENVYELTGFYVSKKYQGKGIGRKLFNLALEFSKNRDIVLDTFSHNTKAIDLYKRWGFEIDTEKGVFFRHWKEWPEGLQAECLYMISRGETRKENR